MHRRLFENTGLVRLFVAVLAVLGAVVALRGVLLAPPLPADGVRVREESAPASAAEPAMETSLRDLGRGTAAELRPLLLPAYVPLRPGQANALYRKGAQLLEEGDYYGALLPLSEAHGAFPESPVFCVPLAQVYHLLNLTREAVALLPCLRGAPEARVGPLRHLIEQLERSEDFELQFEAAASDHFVASYPSGGSAARRIGEVLDLLERASARVGWLSGIQATRQIPVVVYEAVDFGEATGAPDWARGAYDGKIRISIEFLENRPTEFADALRHEYLHAALRELTGNRVPAWMHEGLANLVTDRRYDADGLRQLMRETGELPSSALMSHSLASLPAETASLAYQQAYWMTHDLVEQHGFGAVAGMVFDLEADPDLGFDEAFSERFRVWPRDYLDRWVEQFLSR